MSGSPIGYYRLTHGQQITVTIPEGPAWRNGQREGLTMTVCHPQRSTYVVGDNEIIRALWFDGQTNVALNIRAGWITDRQRILPGDPIPVA